jgi:hypothetical protein
MSRQQPLSLHTVLDPTSDISQAEITMLFVAGFCTLVLVSLTFYFYFSKMFIDI